MRVFSDLKGEEGIEKLLEVSKDINVVLDTANSIKDDDDASWIELGGNALKKYPGECRRIIDTLGDEVGDDALSMTAAMAAVMFDILSNPELRDFFTSVSRSSQRKPRGSASESTEAAP